MKGKPLSTKLSDRVHSNNATPDHISYISRQNSTYEGDKRTKRKREASLPEGSSDNGGSIAKRHKSANPVQSLTRENLELLEESMAPSSSTKPRGKSAVTSFKRSSCTEPSSVSSVSTRAYAAKDPRFEVELRGLNVDYTELEKPDAEEVARVLEIMDRKRDSPEPDSKLFHQTRCIVKRENESKVTHTLSPLLLVQRELPCNNCKTRNLLYRQDVPWLQWGSAQPGRLPTPKPDLCITYKDSAFNPVAREQMVSPYIDTAGFAPFLICEVKTALQGDQIADRQNANNVISVMKADFDLQQRLGRDRAMERKIRIITIAHNTRNQWYDAWFYVFGDNGKPKWCPYRIKHINFEIPKENGFETARGCFLNLSEYMESVILQKLQADLVKASPPGPNHYNKAATLSGLTPDLEPQVQTNTQLSTESHASAVLLLDNRHDSVADLQPTPKRPKIVTRSVARSMAQPKRGDPKK